MIYIETDRLILRNYQLKDIDDFYELMSQELLILGGLWRGLAFVEKRILLSARNLLMRRMNMGIQF